MTVSESYVFISATLFIAFQFYKRGILFSREGKVFLAFCVWLFVTRLFNGDFWLAEDFHLLFENLFLLALLPTAFLMRSEQRKTMLCVVAAGFGLYYAIVAVCGIYSALFPVAVGNPFCPVIDLADFGYGGRLRIFGLHPNITSIIFYIALWLLIYLFFAVKRTTLRILIVIPAALIFCAMALTYSRNTFLAFSVTFSLLIARFVLNLLANKKGFLRYSCFALTLVLCITLSYTACEKVYSLVGISYGGQDRFGYNSSGLVNSLDDKDLVIETTPVPVPSPPEAAEPVTPSVSPDEQAKPVATGRGFEDTGRIALYRLTAKALFANPKQLFVGELNDNIMEPVNKLLLEKGINEHSHPHNLFLYVLLITGVPGLGLIVLFLVLLLKRILTLYFRNDSGIKTEHRVLVLFLGGIMMYNMLEISFIANFDIRSIAFVFIAGAVIAYEKELICK